MTRKESKKITREVYQKHFGKKGVKKDRVATAVADKTKAQAEAKPKKTTVAELKQQAKTAGIKNFQVLNRAELERVLAPGVTLPIISEVVTGAVARWKAGWGTKGKRATGGVPKGAKV
jgi:hypothetical protein